MNTIYFYMYLSIVILATLGFTFLRCVHGVKEFDMFFYPNPNNNIVENQVYLLSHILVNFLIGYLFGFEVFVGTPFRLQTATLSFCILRVKLPKDLLFRDSSKA